MLKFLVLLVVVAVLCKAVPHKKGHRVKILKRFSDYLLVKRSNLANSTSCLSSHNTKRQLHEGVSDLTWSSDLASQAYTWAKYLLDNDLWEHDPNLAALSQGENLYKGEAWSSSSAPAAQTCTDAANNWYSEINNYNWTHPSSPNGVIGHFTQMVWKATSQLGVGIASKSEEDGNWQKTTTVIAARYTPPGNNGDLDTNVPSTIS